MSMTAVPMSQEVAAAAYRLTTDGVITQPQEWQSNLYALLSQPDHEAADLLLTPTGAGKTEAILIPALGLRRGGAPRRLFQIAPDGSTLDDALYRLVPYLRAWVAADETPRTLCVDASEDEAEGNECRRFFPDGTEDPHLITNPLEADVDVILTTLSRFRALFFGAGGVHALPSAMPISETSSPLRRDLFFFDEAHSYAQEAFNSFHRLVEFLYAEDADLIVASTTMPLVFQEELSFLERVHLPVPSGSQACVLSYRPTGDPIMEMERELRRVDSLNIRTIAVLETPADAEALHARMGASSHRPLFLYHPAQPAEPRRRTYADLREQEKQGAGYLLLTTGDAVETSDLDARRLLTTPCPPENLIRRAGRCNRRGIFPQGEMIVLGTTFAPQSRPILLADAYLAALKETFQTPFDPDFWKRFIQ